MDLKSPLEATQNPEVFFNYKCALVEPIETGSSPAARTTALKTPEGGPIPESPQMGTPGGCRQPRVEEEQVPLPGNRCLQVSAH
jgi:hypothetical protein